MANCEVEVTNSMLLNVMSQVLTEIDLDNVDTITLAKKGTADGGVTIFFKMEVMEIENEDNLFLKTGDKIIINH